MFRDFYKKNQGSLLLNVLVSFGIIALMATLSIPYIRQYQPNLKLNATARDLTSDLRYAQQLTITEQAVYLVDLDLNNDSYQVLKGGAATTTIKTVEFDSDVSFQQVTGLADNQVIFNFYGGVSESGQITLVNTNGKTAVINVKPSGYVQLEQ
ncbi:MAG: GspH/FimT family protein [Patescibacteria group bacterium]|nr:GspH/FimT family protein [Patescibacteria group bacterium]MDD5294958.1 GspH/FimT family protein [Patescibacteria group bacterium]MDD5554224.1 GspH/FimT family protein [Patescibacteria group bacterium]